MIALAEKKQGALSTKSKEVEDYGKEVERDEEVVEEYDVKEKVYEEEVIGKKDQE